MEHAGRTGADVQVLVVGSGVGGLAVAAFLRRAGLDPVVVGRGGFGDASGSVELWPEAVRLLDRLGVGDGVRADGSAVTVWHRRRPDGTVASRLESVDGPGLVAVAPARLRERLRSVVPDGRVHAGLGVDSLDETGGGVTVRFANGVREQFDVVVGADGVHSTTRTAIAGEEPAYCGTTSVGFPLEPGVELDGVGEIWTTEGAVFRAVPAGDRPNGWLTVPTDVPVRNWDEEPTFEVLRPDVAWFLPESLDGRPARWADDFRTPAERWAEGRVALVGDAAHARHRLAGLGPTMAIEDGAVLAAELVDGDGPFAARLAAYATRRRSRFEELGTADGTPLSGVESELVERCPDVTALRGGRVAACFGGPPPAPPVDRLPGDG